ncbi:MAG: sortase [Chloroflexota bacterium]|nr:sortase [Chloroflexota bacterium]MDE3102827.1 sortase [Chloroflexota bacterium]
MAARKTFLLVAVASVALASSATASDSARVRAGAPSEPSPEVAATTIPSAAPPAETLAVLVSPAALAGVPTAAPGIRSASPTPLPSDLSIEIPRLGIQLPLVGGDLTRDTPGPAFPGGTPERVALIYPGSAPLAEGGNTYVYAHARRGMFLSLWGAQVGDAVRIGSGSTGLVLSYTVTRVVPRVPPSDTSWLDPSGPERLTLQTSTGPSPTDPRFIVVAMRDR